MRCLCRREREVSDRVQSEEVQRRVDALVETRVKAETDRARSLLEEEFSQKLDAARSHAERQVSEKYMAERQTELNLLRTQLVFILFSHCLSS